MPDQPMANDNETEQAEPMTFGKHRDATVNDLTHVRDLLDCLIRDVRTGDMDAFEKFWIEGGTEEGDAKIFQLREMLLLRYIVRSDSIER